MNYEKMYHLLFNAITDALEQMEKQNLGSAKALLTTAQQKTEEIYMESANQPAASAAMLPRQAPSRLIKSNGSRRSHQAFDKIRERQRR